jgi:hypothetical protein
MVPIIKQKGTPGRAFDTAKYQAGCPSALQTGESFRRDPAPAFEPFVTKWGCACAFLGREKGAWIWLRRHPLIDPIFGPIPILP